MKVVTSSGVEWGLDVAPVTRGIGRIAVVGLGIRLPEHLTAETIETLSTSSAIYTLEPRDWYAHALGPVAGRIVDLSPLFAKHPLRDDALREAASIVVDDGAQRAGVTFALGGHPTVAVAPVIHLFDLARARNVTVEIRPAASSVDVVLADLGLDPGACGLQIVRGSAAEMLSSRLPAVVLCPGYAEDCEPAKRTRELALLARDLVGIYGEDAELIVYSATADARVRVMRAVDVATIPPIRLGRVLLVGPMSLLPNDARARAAALVEGARG